MALMYLALEGSKGSNNNGGSADGSGSGDPLGDIIEDYE